MKQMLRASVSTVTIGADWAKNIFVTLEQNPDAEPTQRSGLQVDEKTALVVPLVSARINER